MERRIRDLITKVSYTIPCSAAQFHLCFVPSSATISPEISAACELLCRCAEPRDVSGFLWKAEENWEILKLKINQVKICRMSRKTRESLNTLLYECVFFLVKIISHEIDIQKDMYSLCE